MTYHIDLQLACNDPIPVALSSLTTWAKLPLMKHRQAAELTLRLVQLDEMKQLNHIYRKQNKVTNVLAFPSVIPHHVDLHYPLLGDVVICPAVLNTETLTWNQSLEAHWAHIVLHGVLHLLGFDHTEKQDADIMQAEEIELLETLGFSNPYQTEGNQID